jgi:hypothetical protein
MEHDIPAACIIAQQYSSAAFSLHWESAPFKFFFLIFLLLEKFVSLKLRYLKLRKSVSACVAIIFPVRVL